MFGSLVAHQLEGVMARFGRTRALAILPAPALPPGYVAAIAKAWAASPMPFPRLTGF
jgi:hypothetical protein